MANYLIYQAYGSPDILNEALFSMLSFLRQPAAATVVVYTDNPAHFRAVLGEAPGITYEHVAPAQWRAWRGDIDFVHRVKIMVLQHAAAHYPGNLLYADTDTVFTQSPAKIFDLLGQGQHFMHLSEGRLDNGNSLNRKINRVLQAPDTPALVGGPIAPATCMYNAGVLGLRSLDAPLLAQVLALTEQLHRLYPKHVTEQLAFSVVWARQGPVCEAVPWVYHYWDLKEIRPVLASLLAPQPGRPLAEWQARAARLDVPALAAGKAQFRALPGWRRAVLRWLGRGWQLPVALAAEAPK